MQKIRRIEYLASPIAKEYGFEVKVLPVKSVGVVGDARQYRYVAELAGPYRDLDNLRDLSSRLTNEIGGIGRVVIRIAT